MGTSSERLVLRDLSLPTRLVLAAFLLSVGLGYFSALVQLHFQHATAGQLLPGPEEAKNNYHGKKGMSQLERLVIDDEHKPFNGSGSMRSAFTFRSGGWKREIRERAQAMIAEPQKGEEAKAEKQPTPEDLAKAEKELRAERDLEVLALVNWIHAGAQPKTYANHPLSEDVAAKLPKEPDSRFFEKGNDGKWQCNVQQLLTDRCIRCHAAGKTDAAGQIHLDKFEVIKDYTEVETNGGGMSLTKLAQSTHVHLLGFSMLFGLTGLIFSFTSYPTFLRLIFGPWTLIAQVADISCWWLGRIDPMFAQAILVTGGLVALGLLIQILGSVFNMFGKPGKTIVLMLILLACAGGVVGKSKVIDPFLEKEKPASAAQ
jgi:hypothetical protein